MKRAVVLPFLLLSLLTKAQWNPDPINNQLCYDAPLIGQNIANDHLMRITDDGSGGAYVTWFDYPNINPQGGMDVKLQHISAAGTTWAGNGITVTNADYNQRFPELTGDGLGGVVVTWYSDIDSKVYAQRVDINGNTLWTTNGIAICNAASGQFFPNIIRCENGNFIIAWKDSRASSDYAIYAQKIDINGNLLWDNSGVVVTPGNVYSSGVIPVAMVSDGNSGMIVNWLDTRSSLQNYVQRILSTGQPAWPQSVEVNPVTTSSGIIVSDGAGGVIVSWSDNRNNFTTKYDIYAQRISNAGNLLWNSNGVPVAVTTEQQYIRQMVSDGNGGAIISWNDWRDFVGNLIYMQRINASGSPSWTVDGIMITDQAYGGIFPKSVSDGAGGAMITWANSDLRVQRVNAAGNLLLGSQGQVVCSRNTVGAPELTKTSTGNSIIAWLDYRNGGAQGIYASRLLSAPLPVKWLSFSGIKTNAGNHLNWKVSDELAIKNYLIERSNDGLHFISIAEQLALSNGNTDQSYNYYDRHPSDGKNYYRIKEVDKDGSTHLSKIILLENNSNAVMLAYPSPVINNCHFTNLQKGDLRLYDARGRLVKSYQVMAGTLDIDMNDLPAGIYIAQNGGESTRIIKK